MFFVSTAPLNGEGHVNLSPKGLDCFRILSPQRAGYMDVIGSGNETAAHLLENGRITFMFCAFDGAPNILRLYGTGRAVLPGQPEFEELAPSFAVYPSTRQIIVADITRVQTSCGFGVPEYRYVGQRDLALQMGERPTDRRNWRNTSRKTTRSASTDCRRPSASGNEPDKSVSSLGALDKALGPEAAAAGGKGVAGAVLKVGGEAFAAATGGAGREMKRAQLLAEAGKQG